tara:strand:- start:473 stop:706 length:234 start_codon:yes stop_codon:yes gene_type:complete
MLFFKGMSMRAHSNLKYYISPLSRKWISGATMNKDNKINNKTNKTNQGVINNTIASNSVFWGNTTLNEKIEKEDLLR